ncbi:hypothetical protein FQN55_007640 [Onygenales sp. PD_40]|nr:hypothetical protein FQN55_007640 [Onygenales sp. PD_40]KAK2759281.1 hypothetical protein FQN53_008087 [Emmonsiellopsis sp. PD_33]KAK2794172.1 hypothetical protein FQN52_009254 [Onygenales sp. PD_12]
MESASKPPRVCPLKNDSSTTAASSDVSKHSHSTAQTTHSQYDTLNYEAKGNSYRVDGRESTDTYASTVLSEEDISNEPDIEVVEERYEDYPSDAIPSSPPSFGELFPSTRRLLIKHDDSTVDGNMNLRIDTLVSEPGGRQCEIILFHLRMYDLRNRKFSLRRYCRESGREVCHSARKYYLPTAEKLPSLQRPLSNALSTLRSKSDASHPRVGGLWRPDSGYKSETEEKGGPVERMATIEALSGTQSLEPTNTIQLEFSNYAHVDVKRRGSKGSKHYDFEYWSSKYQWKRTIRRDGDTREISYHLFHGAKSKPVAQIFPEPLTPLEAVEERSKGGWVAPCSMWINDSSLFESMKDVAEYVTPVPLLKGEL